MAINKSVIEELELSTGTVAYIQSSSRGRVVISFDGAETSFNITVTEEEAKQLSDHLNKVLEQING